jgi:aspartate/methionine/tyrosine aminotransferase
MSRISERLRVSRRIAAITESATLAVDAKAKALKAAGEDVIGFGAGEPDFATPAHIVEAAIVACSDPAMHHYTPAAGLPALRAAIAAKTERDSGFACSAGQVLVTNGGKQAVYNAFQVLLDGGDEVLLPAPYWTTYPEPVRFSGGVVDSRHSRSSSRRSSLSRRCKAFMAIIRAAGPQVNSSV